MKKSLVAGAVTPLYAPKHGTASHPAEIDFRIDPAALDTIVIRYAYNWEAQRTVEDDVAFPSDDWMPLLTSEVKSGAQIITGELVYVVASANVDIFFAPTHPTSVAD